MLACILLNIYETMCSSSGVSCSLPLVFNTHCILLRYVPCHPTIDGGPDLSSFDYGLALPRGILLMNTPQYWRPQSHQARVSQQRSDVDRVA